MILYILLISLIWSLQRPLKWRFDRIISTIFRSQCFLWILLFLLIFGNLFGTEYSTILLVCRVLFYGWLLWSINIVFQIDANRAITFVFLKFRWFFDATHCSNHWVYSVAMFVSAYTDYSISITYKWLATINTLNFINALVFMFDFVFCNGINFSNGDRGFFLYYL